MDNPKYELYAIIDSDDRVVNIQPFFSKEDANNSAYQLNCVQAVTCYPYYPWYNDIFKNNRFYHEDELTGELTELPIIKSHLHQLENAMILIENLKDRIKFLEDELHKTETNK